MCLMFSLSTKVPIRSCFLTLGFRRFSAHNLAILVPYSRTKPRLLIGYSELSWSFQNNQIRDDVKRQRDNITYIQSVWFRTLNNCTSQAVYDRSLNRNKVWLRPTAGSAGITLQKAVFWTQPSVMWWRLALHEFAFHSTIQDIPWILR